MPTRRGLGSFFGGLAVVALGLLFGLPEAVALGVVAVALPALALAWVRASGRGPAVWRTVRPARVTVGDRCDVVVSVRNEGRRRTPPTLLRDLVDGAGSARVLVGPLEPGEEARSRYSLSTDRRGVHRVGPLETRAGGAFRLARFDTHRLGTVSVVVLPRVVPLPPLPASAGDEPELGTRSMVAVSTVDEEFTGLRGYVPGDDVRRIHWPSSARAGGALVRQFEVPWQRRTTLLVDVRADRHDPESFERTVTVAASVSALASAGSELVRVGTTEHPDPPFVTATDHLDALLDRFALLTPQVADGDLVTAVERATVTATGRLVVCTGELPRDELDAVLRASSRAGISLLVTTGGSGPSRAAGGTGGVVRVHWDGISDLATLWRSAGDALRAPGVGSR